MTTIVLDTLAYAEKLKSGGFSEQQAATQAHALAEIIDRQMVTKAEVEAHENNLRTRHRGATPGGEARHRSAAPGDQARHRREQGGTDPLGCWGGIPSDHAHHRRADSALPS
ncbi:MAG: CCDC90 family protein [Chromatiales bacterium]|nr:CCDC90 family protein [Chromatiales bacterium]